MSYNPSSAKKIGLLLQESSLVSPAQIEVALYDQMTYNHLRLGEILSLRGWIKQETVDFFADRWPSELHLLYRKRIGYYLKSAALLDDRQILSILGEQPKLGLRFGAIAVLHGWLRQETLNFFLENLSPRPKKRSAFIDRRRAMSAPRIFSISKPFYRKVSSKGTSVNADFQDLSVLFDEESPRIGEVQVALDESTDFRAGNFSRMPEGDLPDINWI
jgi:hypothetical protein